MGRCPDPAKERFWRHQVGDQTSSGERVRTFCQERDLSENSFYVWRREIARRDQQVDADTGKSANRPVRLTPPAFIPVDLTSITTQPIELVHPSGSLVRLSPGVDWHDVARLFEVLDASREVRQ